MSPTNNALQDAAIADYYQLLALLLRLPTAEVEEGFISGSIADDIISNMDEAGFPEPMQEEVNNLVVQLAQHVEEGHANLGTLRRTYTKLFTNPKMPMIGIYESLFRYWKDNPSAGWDNAPRLFISPAALDAERCYKKAGLSRSDELNESGDYMVTELEFMARLYSHRATLNLTEDAEEFTATSALIKEFNHYHFEKWGVDFFTEVSQVAPNSIYQVLGAFGALFMAHMLDSISDDQ